MKACNSFHRLKVVGFFAGFVMKKYQYLLFDLDGTLTDSKQGITKCVQYALGKMGWEIPPIEELLCFIGPPLLVSFQEYCGMSEEEAKKATAFYRERYAVTGLFENEVYFGIPETLKRLKEAGYILAIATSKPEEYLIRILEHFHLNDYFAIISGSGLSGERNSKAKVIKDALCQLAVWKYCEEKGEKRERKRNDNSIYREQKVDEGIWKEIQQSAIMIGDRHHDIEGAMACGIDSLGIHYGYAEQGELKEAGAVYEVDLVEDIGKFFL